MADQKRPNLFASKFGGRKFGKQKWKAAGAASAAEAAEEDYPSNVDDEGDEGPVPAVASPFSGGGFAGGFSGGFARKPGAFSKFGASSGTNEAPEEETEGKNPRLP